MIASDIPGFGRLRLERLVLDVNGTIACDGVAIDGVAERLAALSETLRVVALTAATHGPVDDLAVELGIDIEVIEAGAEAERKRDHILRMGSGEVCAIGNGANDVLMLREAAVGIAVLGPEGTASEALAAADIAVRGITEALDLLLYPARLVATLRC